MSGPADGDDPVEDASPDDRVASGGGDRRADDDATDDDPAEAGGSDDDEPADEADALPDPAAADDGALDRLRDRVGDPAVAAVLLIVVGSLLLRTVQLGSRVFHWDEGRVAYWILRFDATGEFFYRPIIHGPFLPVVNNVLFDLIGASDFAARLPVAVVGGLLPLAALLLRHRLRDREVVALALVLAADPLLVYYGRFMRGDVLVGSFCVAAFALVVYAIDTRRTLPLFGSAALLALGFTAKENALVYLACFLGAAVLLLDHRLVRTASRTGSPLDAVVGEAVALARFLDGWTEGARTRRWIERRVRDRVGDGDAATGTETDAGDADRGNADRGAAGTPAPYAPEAGLVGHLAVWVPVVAVGVVATFLGVTSFFYAPRPELWQALGVASQAGGSGGSAATLGSVLTEATWGSGEKFWGTWAAGSHSGHPYVPYLFDIGETLAYGSAVLAVFAAVGFVADGYGSERGTRPLVAYAAYWGLASLVGYPVATDIQAPWAAIHIVLPLSIPAAVGVAHVGDSLRTAIAREDVETVIIAGLIVFAAVAGVAAPTADYWNSAAEEDKQVLQWAQPENDYKDALRDAQVIARNHEGTDVLWVGTDTPRGTRLYVEDESSVERMPPGGPSWHSRLPTPWYLELADAEQTSTPPSARFDGLPEEMPPVVFAKPDDADELEQRLDGYESREYAFRLWTERIVVFIDEEELERAYELEAESDP
ncbi:TIGR03663 family protein [Halobaculum sp. CBA1158]|uniref:flippase activity-associated protein Agl23 n=1 Tax=Halobaculum sp. CBA1158 TaxID=2904243 RepID=UPI001F3F25B9|nr:flippase activity-associated protein Agl23 [Halobaculum sp. CBA1158]UIO99336.1 TIGR03663 family protein [Halobaculum sp. CBA1158]